MKTSDLRHQIIIQQQTKATNSFGHVDITWTNSQPVYANVVAKKSDEVDVGGRLQMVTDYEVFIRYPGSPNVPVNSRILYGDRVLAVTGSADPDGKRKYLKIWASEGRAA